MGALLRSAAEQPDRAIAELEIVRKAERLEFAVRHLPPAKLRDQPRTVLDDIREQALRTPDAPAIVYESGTVTYRQLVGRAAFLADRLLDAGVVAGNPVAVCLDRTPDLIAALLAAMWIGSPYVPLDPDHPLARRLEILKRSHAALVMTDAISGFDDADIKQIAVHELGEADAGFVPPPQVSGELAYLMFTSGSTGRPKGVEIEHAALRNLLCAMQSRLNLSLQDILLAITTSAFDISTVELFLPLMLGARIVLGSREAAHDGHALKGLLAGSGATVMQATPATWSMLFDAGWLGGGMLKAICGGEALTPGLSSRLLERVPTLWNAYGPTEATVWATVQDIDKALAQSYEGKASVPIGNALTNMATLILDNHQAPVPEGAAGELYIAGAGVARGYLDDPLLTAERFPSIRISASHSERCYRTGDIVRREDGRLVFLHRRDQQIKFHGFRIEPAEIEMQIEAFPGVAHAVVDLRNDGAGQRMLAAYVVAENGTIEPQVLRGWLANRLPSYMVPQAFVNLSRLPTGPTGKVDRKALPAPTRVASSSEAASKPRTNTERRLLEILKELLVDTSIGVSDSFFDLGGHSLAAAKVFVRIAQVFGVTLPVRTLSFAPTVSALAAAIDDALAGRPLSQGRDFADNLRRDAALPERIRPQNRLPAVEPAQILLTGATGFLGGYLLAELLERTSATLHCVVRAESPQLGRRRLIESLVTKNLWREELAERVKVYTGDLTADRLGLDDATSNHLRETVGAIYHCGAQVSFVLPYPELKRANVDATMVLLELACAGKPKAFHYISTLSVFDQLRYFDGGEISETTLPELLSEPLSGYAASKWVAEQLVWQAKKRGLPATIHRSGIIAGHSRTGFWNPSELIPTAIKGCIQLGIAPALDIGILMTPVDFVARAVVASSHSGLSSAAFHPVADQALKLSQITAWLRNCGHNIENVPYDEWRAHLREVLASGQENALAPVSSLFLEPIAGGSDLTIPELLSESRRPNYTNRQAAAALGWEEMSLATIDEEVFRRYVRAMA